MQYKLSKQWEWSLLLWVAIIERLVFIEFTSFYMFEVIVNLSSSFPLSCFHNVHFCCRLLEFVDEWTRSGSMISNINFNVQIFKGLLGFADPFLQFSVKNSFFLMKPLSVCVCTYVCFMYISLSLSLYIYIYILICIYSFRNSAWLMMGWL